MKKYDRITPVGTKDLLFQECKAQRKIENILRQKFEEKAYHEVITPGFEFYDVFSSNSMYFPQENMYKMVDNNGRLLVMRPDSTIPIARLTATKLKGHALPIRLFYGQKVYRNQPELRGKNTEIMQMGIELIGSATFEADMEALTTGIEALSACSNSEFRIEIGHIGIFKLLMNNLEATQEEKATIHTLILSKNYAALSDELEKFPAIKTVEILREIPKLFGGRESLETARALFQGYDDRIMEMLSYLEKIYENLVALKFDEKVIIDFGLVNQAEYYSALIFRGYIESAGEPVLSGGRYDDLFKDFGEDLPATGFAINVDQLAINLLKETGIREKEAADREKGKGSFTADENSKDKKIRIALTKGRLEDNTVALFESVGYDVTNLREKGRKLLLTIPNTNIEVVLAKAADVITYVEHGVCDLGVVGKDTIAESGGIYYEVLDLGFGKCKFALAVPKDSDFYSGYTTKTIATKYPKVAGAYFESKGMDIEIIKIEGSVELAPLLNLADGIVDIVETGTTLKENGLEVIEDIRKISARLIVNEASMKLKKAEIEELLSRIQEKLSEEA